jgi:hypothetical protein
LCRTQPVFEPETEPLDPHSVSHPTSEVCCIRSLHLRYCRQGESIWWRYVLAHTPNAGLLVLSAQHKRVKELRTLRMWCILQNSSCLRPRHKLRLCRESYFDAFWRVQANATSESDSRGTIQIFNQSRWRPSSADPSRILAEESIEPYRTVSLHTLELVSHRCSLIWAKLELSTYMRSNA